MDDIDKITNAIARRPQDFSSNGYRLRDKKTGVDIWISNGFWFYGIFSPREVKFSFRQKVKFHWFFVRYRSLFLRSERDDWLHKYATMMDEA